MEPPLHLLIPHRRPCHWSTITPHSHTALSHYSGVTASPVTAVSLQPCLCRSCCCIAWFCFELFNSYKYTTKISNVTKGTKNTGRMTNTSWSQVLTLSFYSVILPLCLTWKPPLILSPAKMNFSSMGLNVIFVFHLESSQ